MLDAPYVPLAILELAGPAAGCDVRGAEGRSFSDARDFSMHAGMADEARRFNRFLIDAGLIKGL